MIFSFLFRCATRGGARSPAPGVSDFNLLKGTLTANA